MAPSLPAHPGVRGAMLACACAPPVPAAADGWFCAGPPVSDCAFGRGGHASTLCGTTPPAPEFVPAAAAGSTGLSVVMAASREGVSARGAYRDCGRCWPTGVCAQEGAGEDGSSCTRSPAPPSAPPAAPRDPAPVLCCCLAGLALLWGWLLLGLGLLRALVVRGGVAAGAGCGGRGGAAQSSFHCGRCLGRGGLAAAGDAFEFGLVVRWEDPADRLRREAGLGCCSSAVLCATDSCCWTCCRRGSPRTCCRRLKMSSVASLERKEQGKG